MRALTENLGWKLFSLAAAFILWSTFVGEVEVATSVPVRVAFRNISPDLELAADPPDSLFLKLKGPSARLGAAELGRIELALDLKNANKPGEQTLNIGATELGLPGGVTLIRAIPSQVRVTLERRAEKIVPVEVRFAGPPPGGYRIVSQRVSPAAVRVIGPEAAINRLDAAPTDPVDLSSTIGNAEFRVPVHLDDPHLRFETGSPVVTVQLSLQRIPKP
jgi:hypothetical protein